MFQSTRTAGLSKPLYHKMNCAAWVLSVKIPDDKVSIVIERLRNKLPKLPLCWACGTGKWNINPELFQYLPFNKGSLVVGGPVLPVVVLHCDNCGHTITFSAIQLGMVDPKTGDLALD
jgi:hypothetical protein